MTNEIKKLQLKQAKRLIDVYNKRLEEIKKSIIELTLAGENTLKLSLEKKKIENALKKLKEEFKETTNNEIKESYNRGTEEQQRRFEALGVAVIGVTQQKTIENIYYTHLSRITNEMDKKLKSFLRTDFSDKKKIVSSLQRLIPPQSGVTELNNISASGLLSSKIDEKRWKTLMQALEKNFKSKDIFTIPYYNKKGDVVRHVKASTYAEMLSRTLTANTYRDAAQESILEQFGEFGDLVEIEGISIYPDSPCIPYQGKILSLTGKTKGYTTIDEAKANGLFHPNCIHSFAVTDRVLKIYAPIQISNNKLGKTDKQIRENAQLYYKENLQGKIFSNPELKNILFSNKGFKKLKSSSANINKLKVLPYIQQIIKQGKYIGSEDIRHPRKDGIIKFHRINANVLINKKIENMSVLIGETRDNLIFYNINTETYKKPD